MNYSISELCWGMSLTPYILSDIADMRKGHSGNMAGNPNFDSTSAGSTIWRSRAGYSNGVRGDMEFKIECSVGRRRLV